MEEATAHRMEEALAKSARGDASAFGDIVHEHQGLVFSLAYHFLHDRASAEELAQEVFLQLYRNLSSIKSAEHLRFWLRKVTSHRSIDQARRNGGRSPVSLEEAPVPSAAAPPADPVLGQKLRQLVAALPEKRRLVVILRYQEELELHEIAEIMEMPINTVKSSLQRSLDILRDKLTRCLGDVRV